MQVGLCCSIITKKEANTFYTLPSWLRHWKRALVRKLGWDDVDARQNFGLYDRILLLDAGVQPFSDEEVLEFFDFTGVPIEIVQADLEPLCKLLRESLHEEAVGREAWVPKGS